MACSITLGITDPASSDLITHTSTALAEFCDYWAATWLLETHCMPLVFLVVFRKLPPL